MKAKTQIEIGRWSAIILLIGAILQAIIVIFIFRNNISDPIITYYPFKLIIFSTILYILFFGTFAFSISFRLFKTSSLLLACFVFLEILGFFRVGYDDYGDIFIILYKLFSVFLLSQGVVGLYRERHTIKK